MDEEGSGETGQPDTALVPATNLDIGGVEDVFTENDTVAGGPAQQDGVRGVHGSSEELGLLEDVFEIVLFTTVPRLTLALHTNHLGETGTYLGIAVPHSK